MKIIFNEENGFSATGFSSAILSVSQITSQIKTYLNREFSDVWIKGEVTEAKLSSTGHLFFSIKDEMASLSCVMFYGKLKKIHFEITPGMVFHFFGNVTVYDKRGTYQLIVDDITPEGQGKFELAFNQMKERLEKEGLFDEQYKKPISKYFRRLGILTSETGAALRDILKTLDVEYPEIDVTIFPIPVQGEEAAGKITKMIEKVNSQDWVDVLLLTRGGGSREDLWVFNEESVARAIFKSKLPIISAIGHEVDITISDLVADHRASTPTQAATFISQFKKNLDFELPLLHQRLKQGIEKVIHRLNFLVQGFAAGHWLKLFHEKMSLYRYETQSLNREGLIFLKQKMKNLRNEALTQTEKLEALSPKKILQRGFALITNKEDEVITDLKKLKDNDVIKIFLKKDAKIAKIL